MRPVHECARCHNPILPDEMSVWVQSTGKVFHSECIQETDTNIRIHGDEKGNVVVHIMTPGFVDRLRTAFAVGIGLFFFALPILLDIALWLVLAPKDAISGAVLIMALVLLSIPVGFLSWLFGAAILAEA